MKYIINWTQLTLAEALEKMGHLSQNLGSMSEYEHKYLYMKVNITKQFVENEHLCTNIFCENCRL